MNKLSIMGVLISEREQIAPKVQEVFTKYGEHIITRFGTHDPSEIQNGLITLHIMSTEEELRKFSNELEVLDGVTVKSIIMK